MTDEFRRRWESEHGPMKTSPERMAALELQEKLFPDKTLPEICMILHMVMSGASDQKVPSIFECLSMLGDRMTTWKRSENAFEESVLALVSATYTECFRYLEEK